MLKVAEKNSSAHDFSLCAFFYFHTFVGTSYITFFCFIISFNTYIISTVYEFHVFIKYDFITLIGFKLPKWRFRHHFVLEMYFGHTVTLHQSHLRKKKIENKRAIPN